MIESSQGYTKTLCKEDDNLQIFQFCQSCKNSIRQKFDSVWCQYAVKCIEWLRYNNLIWLHLKVKRRKHLLSSCNTLSDFNMKAVFWLGIMGLNQIYRSRFKQSKISLLIPQNFFGDFSLRILGMGWDARWPHG